MITWRSKDQRNLPANAALCLQAPGYWSGPNVVFKKRQGHPSVCQAKLHTARCFPFSFAIEREGRPSSKGGTALR